MKTLVRLISGLSWLGAVLSGAMLCLALILFVAEIILRSFFSSTLYITDEYAGYLMAALTFCSLAYTLSERGHIRMTFLHQIIKGRRRAQLDIICCIVGFSFCTWLFYLTGSGFLDSLATGSRSMQISETPLAIPQFFLPFGSLLLMLQFIAEIMRSILFLRGDAEVTVQEEDQALGR